MKHNIIKTDDYLLVVDESEIKAGEFYLLIPELVVKMSRSGLPSMAIEWKKIIAHLPLNGSPILEGVDLLPPLEEDDAEKKARELTNHLTFPEERKEGIIIGYNKAKEKYKYTEEDLRNALFYALYHPKEDGVISITKDFIVRKSIQSLSQPKMPIGFECVTQKLFKHNEFMEREFYDSILTTTTPEGHTQWVGTYIYEVK